jgi:hypothetical protein
LTGVFIISPLPPVLLEEIRTAGLLRSTGVTPSPRYYEPIRHPLAVSRFPGCSGYTAYPASALSGRDEEGFSSCSMHPCLRAIAKDPGGATRRVNRLRTSHAAFALTVAGSASGSTHLRGHLAFTVVTARKLAPTTPDGGVEGLQTFGFPPACPPATGLPILTPAGLAPAGYISLSWTHNRA